MPLKVYYLDDEVELCENFADYFESVDVQVTTFTDPKQAIDSIKSNPPDLIFVDYRLPGTTGDQVALALDPRIPKILITGDLSVVTSYEFIAILSKPFKHSDIYDILGRYRKKAA